MAFVELGVDEVQTQAGPSNAPSRTVLERVGMSEDASGRIEVREAGDLAYALRVEPASNAERG